jgi:hypothetical protein
MFTGGSPVELAAGVPAGGPAVSTSMGVPAGVVTADGVGVLVGRAVPAGTVRVTVEVAVTVLVGPATVAVTVGRGRSGRVAGAVITWVEAAGSEWPAPPITTPASRPAAAASVTGRRRQFRGGSVPNMAS